MGETFATSRAGGRGRGGERFGFDVNFPIPLPSPPSHPRLAGLLTFCPYCTRCRRAPWLQYRCRRRGAHCRRRRRPPASSPLRPPSSPVATRISGSRFAAACCSAQVAVAFAIDIFRCGSLCELNIGRKEIFGKSKKVCWFGSVIVVKKTGLVSATAAPLPCCRSDKPADLIFDASACYSPLEDGAGLISSDWLDAFLFR